MFQQVRVSAQCLCHGKCQVKIPACSLAYVILLGFFYPFALCFNLLKTSLQLSRLLGTTGNRHFPTQVVYYSAWVERSAVLSSTAGQNHTMFRLPHDIWASATALFFFLIKQDVYCSISFPDDKFKNFFGANKTVSKIDTCTY